MLGDYLTPGGPGTSLRDGAPQGMGNMMNVPGQMMQQQKQAGGLKGFLQGGGLGLLPMLLAGGNMGGFKGVGLSGLLGGGGGAGGLLASLFGGGK